MTTIDRGLPVPPLDQGRFDGSFKHFRSVKGLELDRELLHIGRKEVDLHALHKEVIEHRGYDRNEVCCCSRHSRPDAMLSVTYSERAKFLADHRHATWLYPIARHGPGVFRGSGSAGHDL
jgi:hypothetical protein